MKTQTTVGLVVLVLFLISAGCTKSFKSLSYASLSQNFEVTQTPEDLATSMIIPTDENASITRAHAAVLVTQTFQVDLVTNNTTERFVDVRLADEHGKEINAIRRDELTVGCALETVNGVEQRRFCPNQQIPRWQFLVFAVRSLKKYRNLTLDMTVLTNRGNVTFADTPNLVQLTHAEAIPLFQAAIDYGLMAPNCRVTCLQEIITVSRGRQILNTAKTATGGATPSTPPTPSPSPAASTTNAKVFMKSPVAAANSNVGYKVSYSGSGYQCTPAQTLNLDGYLTPVKIENTTGAFLANGDINVLPEVRNIQVTTTTLGLGTVSDPGVRAQRDSAGNWLPQTFSTLTDINHLLGQVMAYYWIDQAKTKALNALPGSWHPRGRETRVFSRCYDLERNTSAINFLGWNAFWSGPFPGGGFVCMGFFGPAEASFDASVYVHEMGHANIDFGTNGAIHQSSNDTECSSADGSFNFPCCPTDAGCSGAINEGQADVHSFITFNSPRLMEGFLNDVRGSIYRNADRTQLLTAQQMFGATSADGDHLGREIHYMGGVWGAAWWRLRRSIGQEKADKLFYGHLQYLTGADTFKTALNKILVTRQQLLPQDTTLDSQILADFQQHGITRP